MKSKKSPLKIKHPKVCVHAFGGLGEVGMNMVGIQSLDDLVVMDCGVMFPDTPALGLEFLAPNFTKLHELAAHTHLRGLVLTHGHEDHIGATGLFCDAFPNVPVYASALTRDLVMSRAEDFPSLRRKKINIFESRKPLSLGGIAITPVCVNHSIPDAHGFVMDTACGRVIYSGDFRYEYENERQFRGRFAKNNYFREYLNRPIFCYLGDSTNVGDSHELKTEKTIAKNLFKILKEPVAGLTVVTLFSSNMERLGAVLEAARALNKKVVLCGRSVGRYLDVAQTHDVVPRHRGLIIDERQMDDYPRNAIVAIATGSQAEPRAALTRMARNTHAVIRFEEGDRVLMSSKMIPGNERAIGRLINNLLKLGVDVITEKEAPIHTSGHAFRQESEMMLEVARPRFFIPIHGEYFHLTSHAKMARALGKKAPAHVVVLHNGQGVELTIEGPVLLPEFDAEKWTYDFGAYMPLASPAIAQRKRMGRHGLIICALKPQLKLYGLGVPIDDRCVVTVEKFYDQLMMNRPNAADVSTQIRAFVRRHFKDRFDRRPYVIVLRSDFVPDEFP